MRGVLAFAGALLALGGLAFAWFAIWPPAVWLIVVGLILALGAAFERRRYKSAEDASPGAGWQMTGERFVEDGRSVTVWYHPASGERRYVRGARSVTTPR